MGRKGRRDRKTLEIAGTDTFDRGNLGWHCLRLVQLSGVAEFDGDQPSFIRENSSFQMESRNPARNPEELPLVNAMGYLDFSGHDNYAEISSTISPFGGWAS